MFQLFNLKLNDTTDLLIYLVLIFISTSNTQTLRDRIHGPMTEVLTSFLSHPVHFLFPLEDSSVFSEGVDRALTYCEFLPVLASALLAKKTDGLVYAI